jgi:hypothetical protein
MYYDFVEHAHNIVLLFYVLLLRNVEEVNFLQLKLNGCLYERLLAFHANSDDTINIILTRIDS